MPTPALAVVTFAAVMPPDMWRALAWAMEVSGVTWIPVVAAPAATEGMSQAITSPACMVIMVPLASSM